MKKTTLLLTGLALLLGGCASVGPKSISANRPAYNIAVQQTNDQELLLNLVRLLYRDTLYFTTVERVAASMEFNQGYSAGGSFSRTSPSLGKQTLVRGLSLGSTLAVNDKPTVFYAPVDGEKFVRQMMTPMNPDLLLMLVKSGWSMDRVLLVGVQEMNGLKNAPTAAGPTPSREPEFREFQEAAKLLRALQREQLLDLAAGPDGKGVELRFVRDAMTRPEAQRLKALMKLNPARDRFRIVSGVEAPDADSIAVTTRPLLSALAYISQGISAPQAHLEAGKVRRTVRADQQPFEWKELLGDVFQVQSADEEPEDASVAILYRGHYFFIPDNDLETKSTFVLLTQLMALHSAPANSGPAMSFSFGK
jgi:hypothetical protein